MNRAEMRRQRKLSEKAAKKRKPGQLASPSFGQQAPIIQQALDRAVRHQTAGRLPEAERIYQQILQTDPNQPVALHLLGVIAHQVGRNDIAVDLITKTLAKNPDYAEAHNSLGKVLRELGKLDEAVATYQKALAIRPDYAVAHNNLGNVLQDLGKLDEAVASHHKALAIKPDNAGAHYNLGNALRDLGKLDEAVATYRKAIAIIPDLAETHSNLGNVLQDLGKLDEAVASHHKALAIKPDNAGAHYNLGNALRELGKLDEAVATYQKALAIRPDYAGAHNNLGNALRDLGKLDEAVASYHKALAIKPDSAETHSNLGNALQDLAKLDEAIATYQKAIAINPHYAGAHNNLGNALKEMGKLDEAVASYHKALAINPDYAEGHRNLAFAKKFAEYDNDIKAMENTYAMPGLRDEQKMYLAFGLGKSFGDLRQYEKAFGYFLIGNAIKRSTYEFSIKGVEEYFGQLKNLFTIDLFSNHQGAGSADETPIFILGMPRSGTTLVEQILSSHPKVHGAGELDYLRRVVTSYFGKIDDASFTESINQASIGDFSSAGGEYIRMIGERGDGAESITDKMPLNYPLIGMIKLMTPNARVIHCRRDPLDTCVSIFTNHFPGHGNFYANDLGELGRYFNLYRDLMNHWHSVLPGFIYDIQYEDLVTDQETQSRALLAYCGLEWNDACLEFYKTDRPVRTASAAQVRRPIYKDSIQSWRRYEQWLEPLLEVL